MYLRSSKYLSKSVWQTIVLSNRTVVIEMLLKCLKWDCVLMGSGSSSYPKLHTNLQVPFIQPQSANIQSNLCWVFQSILFIHFVSVFLLSHITFNLLYVVFCHDHASTSPSSNPPSPTVPLPDICIVFRLVTE